MVALTKHIPAPLRKVASRITKAFCIFIMLFWVIGGFSLLTACTSSSGGSATLTGEGNLITLPEDLNQSGYYTVTCYDDFHGRWSAGTGQQAVDQEWTKAGCQWTDDIASIDGLYLVACADTYGNAGDRVKFTLSDGTEISAIIADIKSSGDANYSEWGHMNGGNCNVIEFEVKRSRYEECGNPGTNGWKTEWANKPVKSVMNYGGGGKVSNDGGLSGCSASSGLTTDYIEAGKKIAADDSVGYSMSTRQRNPNVDCSSFVWYSLKDAGYSEDQIGSYPFATGGMKSTLTAAGFTWHDFDVSKGESQLQSGDILWCDGHTEFYIGDGQTLGAHMDYDGKDGDSGGKEVCPTTYFDSGYSGYFRPNSGTTHSGGTASASGLTSCSGMGGDSGGKGQEYQAAAEWQRNIVDKCYSTSFAGDGYCAMWVSNVYQNAGYSRPGGNANDMWRASCKSTDRTQLQVGMTIAVEHSGASGDSWNYGHVGIYIGDNKVMHNESSSTGNSDNGCTITDLDEWIEHYDYSSTVAWGYPSGVNG